MAPPKGNQLTAEHDVRLSSPLAPSHPRTHAFAPTFYYASCPLRITSPPPHLPSPHLTAIPHWPTPRPLASLAHPSRAPTNTQAIILRAVVASVLANRRAIYATPGLEDVNANSGSRINQRVQQMLKKMCGAYGVSGVVEAEVASASSGKGGSGEAKKGSPKKRKGKHEEEEVKDEDDY